MIGTKKYNLAGICAGVSFVTGVFLLSSSLRDKSWLETNSYSKGWRREGNYTVVDYDFYKKEMNRGEKNLLGALALFSTSAGLIYYSRRKRDFKAQIEDEFIKFKKNIKIQKNLEKKIKDFRGKF